MTTAMPSRRTIFLMLALLFNLSACSSIKENLPNLQIPKTIVFRGNSMSPAIQDGQTLKIENVQVSDLKRGDVLFFQKDGNKMIKRLVGLPKETVEIREAVVYINDQALDEPYVAEPAGQSVSKVKLADDEYYVLGDNRNNSQDSRTFGPVKAADILGVVILNP